MYAADASEYVNAFVFVPTESEESQSIAENFNKIRERLFEAESLDRKSTKEGLFELFDEICREDWDGYGALPVLPQTRSLSLEFANAIPFGIKSPTIGAEPDGHVTFEWYTRPNRTISISIGPNRKIHYAAIIGGSEKYGTEPFIDAIPGMLLQLIRDVCDQ